MFFRNLDANDDWTFGKGKQNYVSGNKAVGLNIKTRLLCWLGDCFFDRGAGIDWLNRLGLKGQRVLLELDLKRVILQSEDVTGIESFSTELVGRDFTANYEVNSKYTGTIEGSVSQ